MKVGPTIVWHKESRAGDRRVTNTCGHWPCCRVSLLRRVLTVAAVGLGFKCCRTAAWWKWWWWWWWLMTLAAVGAVCGGGTVEGVVVGCCCCGAAAVADTTVAAWTGFGGGIGGGGGGGGSCCCWDVGGGTVAGGMFESFMGVVAGVVFGVGDSPRVTAARIMLLPFAAFAAAGCCFWSLTAFCKRRQRINQQSLRLELTPLNIHSPGTTP